MTSPTGDTSELVSALQAYVDACSGPGITLYEGHPAVLMAKAKLALTTLERELEDARAANRRFHRRLQFAERFRTSRQGLRKALWHFSIKWLHRAEERQRALTASQAEVEKLRNVLKPFAEWPGYRPNAIDSTAVWTVTVHSKEKSGLVMSDFRRARTALHPHR